MNQVVTFREALAEEASTLALVNARAYAFRDGEPAPIIAEVDDILDIKERISKPDVWTRVATTGNKVVGFALGYPRVDTESVDETIDTEYLSLLAVDPDFQGHGTASQLLDLVAQDAITNGRDGLVLWTTEADNEHARTFYENRGFELTGSERATKYGHQIEYRQNLLDDSTSL